MLELNFFSFVLILLLFVILMIIYWYSSSRQLSSNIPSVTNGFWNTIRFSWIMAMKQPKGEHKNNNSIRVFDYL